MPGQSVARSVICIPLQMCSRDFLRARIFCGGGGRGWVAVGLRKPWQNIGLTVHVENLGSVPASRQSLSVADLRGAHLACAPPTDHNFFNFIGFFRKYY